MNALYKLKTPDVLGVMLREVGLSYDTPHILDIVTLLIELSKLRLHDIESNDIESMYNELLAMVTMSNGGVQFNEEHLYVSTISLTNYFMEEYLLRHIDNDSMYLSNIDDTSMLFVKVHI